MANNRKQPTSKLLKIDEVLNHCRILNELLSSYISQDDKSSICTVIESLLFSIGKYRGYQNLYWLQGGSGDYEDYIKKMEGYGFTGEGLARAKQLAEASKDRFIIGPAGAEAKRTGNTKFTDYTQGEYSRMYYI